jgi:hypothetical protein
MRTTPPGQFPDSFNRIEIGAVRRQEIQYKAPETLISIWFMQFRMMIPGVVGDNNNLLVGLAACLSQFLEKLEECFSIESGLFAPVYKFTVVKPDGAKIAYALAGWLMAQNRIAVFWCYPHTTSGAMLLEMNFVDCP